MLFTNLKTDRGSEADCTSSRAVDSPDPWYAPDVHDQQGLGSGSSQRSTATAESSSTKSASRGPSARAERDL